MKNEKLTKEIILKAIYKHRALSVKQLNKLFFKKTKSHIGPSITKYKKNGWINVLKTHIGNYYYLTNAGAKIIGFERLRPIKSVNEKHTDIEIETLLYYKNKNLIHFTTYEEWLNSYQTDREIKNEKFKQGWQLALKMRWVDLIINTTEGKVAIEVEISRKMPRRYIEIVKKLENQYQNEKWDELIYIVYEKDIDWIEKQLTKQYLGINLSIIKVETILKINQLDQKEK